MADLKPIFLPLLDSSNSRWEIDTSKSLNELILELRRITDEFEARIKVLETP